MSRRRSWRSRAGGGEARDCPGEGKHRLVEKWVKGFDGDRRTMGRPLMPMMKSYHGSICREGLVFRSTWNPDCGSWEELDG